MTDDSIRFWRLRCPGSCRADGLEFVPVQALAHLLAAAGAEGRAEGLREAQRLMEPALAKVKGEGFAAAIGGIRLTYRDLGLLADAADHQAADLWQAAKGQAEQEP